MIACDDCNTWQHSRCMGFRRRSDLPEKYYCNLCRPEKMRVGCIAHPRYKEKISKDREGREAKRDQDALLSAVKPTDLRKIFLADLKHKKSLVSAGKQHMIMKYASLMKIQFSKHRQSILDGLVVLLDIPPPEVSERFDAAISKLRQPEKHDSDERNEDGSNPLNDSTQKDAIPYSAMNGKSGAKRQRPSTGPSDPSEDFSLPGPESSQSVEIYGEMDMNEVASLRGMTREERKLRETMKLFARMEEREKKRPRVSDNTSSQKSGQQSHPKTPRGGSRTTSKPGTPNTPVEWDYRRNRTPADRDEHSVNCGETSRDQDEDDDGAPLSLKNESPSACDKSGKAPNCSRHSYKSASSIRLDTEMAQVTPTPKRERSKPERNSSRRRDNAELNASAGSKRQMISERTRSHDIKRRRIGARDGCGRVSKDAPKPDPRLNFSIHVPGPSVLGSKLIPNWRLSQLEVEGRKADADEASTVALKAHPLIKKDTEVRREHLPWEVKLIEATPMKKRVRVSVLEMELNAVHASCKADDENDMKSAQVERRGVGNVENKSSILKRSIPSDETVGEWKNFCLKKRRKMLDIDMNESDPSALCSKMETFPEASAVISPISPSGAGTLSATKSSIDKNGLVANAQNARDGSVNSICSPKLRSSPVSAMRTPKLRSVPALTEKRARSSPTDERSNREVDVDASDGKSPALKSATTAGEISKEATETGVQEQFPNGISKRLSNHQKAVHNSRGADERAQRSEDAAEVKTVTANEREVNRSEGGVSCPSNKLPNETKKTISIPLSKPAPTSWGPGSGLSPSKTSTPRKSFSLGAGISIRSVPISQLTGSTNAALDTSKPGRAAPDDLRKVVEPEKDVEGTIDILQQRLECFANPVVNKSTGSKGSESSNGMTNMLVGVGTGVVTGIQSSGASSVGGMERFRRGGDARGLGGGTHGSSDRPLSEPKEGWKESGWGSGPLPSFASHKRIHSYHHMSGRTNRGSGPNSGSNGGSGVASYGMVRSDEERKGWNSGHDSSYRGGASYGWGDGSGRNGRRRRQLE